MDLNDIVFEHMIDDAIHMDIVPLKALQENENVSFRVVLANTTGITPFDLRGKIMYSHSENGKVYVDIVHLKKTVSITDITKYKFYKL